MTLHMIGLGLHDEKDITLKGLETVRQCTRVYLEYYTSVLQVSKETLEKQLGTSITLADRAFVEQSNDLLEQAQTEEVAFLVVGDPLTATTHINLYVEATKQNIPVTIVHNASIINAVGTTGLQLYKFGKTASIPFAEDYSQIDTPYRVVKENRKHNLHSLLLLDLDPPNQRYMTVKEAGDILLAMETHKGEGIITQDTKVVGCAQLGSPDPVVKAGTVNEIRGADFGAPPHSLIVPATQIHFMEEEALELQGKAL